MTATKEELGAELAELLASHLDEDSYTHVAPDSANGNLPLDISCVRIEPWLYGAKGITLEGAWNLCKESALRYGKTPVLAHQWHGDWVFRAPMYLANIEMIDEDSETSHRFDATVEMSVKAFAIFLTDYQDQRATIEGWSSAIHSVVGAGS